MGYIGIYPRLTGWFQKIHLVKFCLKKEETSIHEKPTDLLKVQSFDVREIIRNFPQAVLETTGNVCVCVSLNGCFSAKNKVGNGLTNVLLLFSGAFYSSTWREML